MNIREYLLTFDIIELYDELFKVFENCGQTVTAGRTQFYRFIKEIKATKPILSQGVICTRPCDDDTYDVFVKEPGDDENYSLLFIKWEEILGYSADEESIALCGRLNYAVWVLWEMTWFGFTNKENEAAISDIENDTEDTEDITDLEGYFAALES